MDEDNELYPFFVFIIVFYYTGNYLMQDFKR